MLTWNFFFVLQKKYFKKKLKLFSFGKKKYRCPTSHNFGHLLERTQTLFRVALGSDSDSLGVWSVCMGVYIYVVGGGAVIEAFREVYKPYKDLVMCGRA